MQLAVRIRVPSSHIGRGARNGRTVRHRLPVDTCRPPIIAAQPFLALASAGRAAASTAATEMRQTGKARRGSRGSSGPPGSGGRRPWRPLPSRGHGARIARVMMRPNGWRAMKKTGAAESSTPYVGVPYGDLQSNQDCGRPLAQRTTGWRSQP